MGESIVVREEVFEIDDHLKIGGATFKDFDQIYKLYFKKKMEVIRKAMNFPGFVARFEEKDKIALLESSKNHTRFKFSFSKRMPGSIEMSYFINDKLVQEIIKVEPQNLVFHGRTFNSMDEIAKFVQENFVEVSYEEYLAANPEMVFKEGEEKKYEDDLAILENFGPKKGRN